MSVLGLNQPAMLEGPTNFAPISGFTYPPPTGFGGYTPPTPTPGGFSKFVSGVSKIAPALNVGLGLVNMITGSIGAIIQYNEQKRQAAKQQRAYRNAIARQKEQMDRQYDLQQQQQEMSKKTFLLGLQKYEDQREDLKREGNYIKAQNQATNIKNLLNVDQGLKNQFLSYWR